MKELERYFDTRDAETREAPVAMLDAASAFRGSAAVGSSGATLTSANGGQVAAMTRLVNKRGAAVMGAIRHAMRIRGDSVEPGRAVRLGAFPDGLTWVDGRFSHLLNINLAERNEIEAQLPVAARKRTVSADATRAARRSRG